MYEKVDLKSYYDSLASVTALYVDVLLIVDGKYEIFLLLYVFINKCFLHLFLCQNCNFVEIHK